MFSGVHRETRGQQVHQKHRDPTGCKLHQNTWNGDHEYNCQLHISGDNIKIAVEMEMVGEEEVELLEEKEEVEVEVEEWREEKNVFVHVIFINNTVSCTQACDYVTVSL
eukprot:748062-Hanusia_phi.AAC.1